jgi:ElaB/YqjD/DUF883 family membrane-anchored ribosome-binding protein
MRKSDIKAQAARFAARTESAISDLANDIKAQVEELADDASQTAEHEFGQARRQMRSAATTVSDSIEDRPFLTVLAVGLVCATLGFLMARR